MALTAQEIIFRPLHSAIDVGKDVGTVQRGKCAEFLKAVHHCRLLTSGQQQVDFSSGKIRFKFEQNVRARAIDLRETAQIENNAGRPLSQCRLDVFHHRLAGAEEQRSLQLHDQNRAAGAFEKRPLRGCAGLSRVTDVATITPPHNRPAHMENEQHDSNHHADEDREHDVERDGKHRDHDDNQEIEDSADAQRPGSAANSARRATGR